MIVSNSGNSSVVDRTVLDRLLRSGITQPRALDHLRGGWVLVDGKTVTDPAAPAVLPSQVELRMVIRRSDTD